MPNNGDASSDTLEESKIKYIEVMRHFLEIKEWNDEFEVNEPGAQVILQTGLNIGEQSGRLFLELNYDTDIVDVFIYYDFRCKGKYSNEIINLLNEIHLRHAFGRFELLPDGRVRWRHRVDFQGSSPTGISILVIVQPGWNCAENFVDAIVAVGMGGQTAARAIEEYDEARGAAQAKSADDAPSEL